MRNEDEAVQEQAAQCPCEHRSGLSRRAMLGAGAVGGAALLTGCADYGSGEEPPLVDNPVPVEAPTEAGEAAGTRAPSTKAPATKKPAGKASSGGAAPAAGALAKTTDIPVGSGKIIAAQKVVVTQPRAGTFAAFSTTCTHAGCAVEEIAGGTINCLCHGSKFAVADGSVKAGPAPKGLAKVAVKVVNGSIVRA